MITAIGVVITALEWPLKASLFPFVSAFILFLLALTNFCLNFFEKGTSSEAASAVDFTLTESADHRTANRRTIMIFLWILGFFVLILLVGFSIAIPIFFILFLKFRGKEKLGTSFALTLIAWLCFYGLFIRLLHVPLTKGWGLEWVRMLFGI